MLYFCHVKHLKLFVMVKHLELFDENDNLIFDCYIPSTFESSPLFKKLLDECYEYDITDFNEYRAKN